MSKFSPKAAEEFAFQEILYEKREWVARVTLNRPKAYNAISTRMLQEMFQALQDASWDDGVAVVVLTGAGDKAFCAGGDVKEYNETFTQRPRDYWKYMSLFQQVIDLLRNLGRPTIARLNGAVVGGGNELNIACDLAVMAEDTFIRQVGPRVGSVACGGATQWLPLIIGDRRAREVLYLCEEIPAQKALEWGLVNYVVSRAELDAKVDELCQKIIDKFPECLRYTQTQVNFLKDLVWHGTIGHARDWLSLHYACWEPLEGMGAFVEKRPPDYRLLRERAASGGSSEFPHGPYARTCSSCGAKNLPRDFRFCGQCGAELGDAAAAS